MKRPNSRVSTSPGLASCLAGKIALVTGSSRGIGKATALELARAGCAVITNTNEPVQAAEATAEECRALGVESSALRADISQPSEVRQLFRAVWKQFGGLDILINNAATFQAGDALDLKDREWDGVFATNCKGTFLCSQEAARVMRQAGGGTIVNLSSLGGAQGWPGMAAYCASKGAIDAMTRALACEWAPYGIRVNAVAPGHVATEGNLKSFVGRRKAWAKERIALARLASPEEIARVIAFVASPACSYLTGQVIYAEGGLMSWQGFREPISQK